MITLISIIIILLCVFNLALLSKIDRFWIIAPPTTMTAYFLLVSFPGTFFASTPDALLNALIAHALWFLGALVAVIWVVPFFSKQKTPLSDARPVTGNPPIFWFFIALSAPAVAFTFYMFGRFPLFIGLSGLLGSDVDISMHTARQMNTLEHRVGDTVYFGQGYLRQIYVVVSPVFLTALYIYWRRNGFPVRRNTVLLLMFLFVVAAALNGQIWVAIHVMLLFFMARYYLVIAKGAGGNNFKIVFRGLGAYFFLIFFVFSYRYLQFLEGRQFESFFFSTIRRIYSAGGVDLFGIFPSQEGFRYGSTWLNDLAGMLPGSIQSFAYEVHYLVHGGNWGFTLSPGIVASSYVNFGFLGVFFAALIFTSIFYYLFSVLVRSDSAIKLAICIYLSRQFMLAMPGDMTSYVVSLMTALLIYLAYEVMRFFLYGTSGSKKGWR